jgi:hypothetical protein
VRTPWKRAQLVKKKFKWEGISFANKKVVAQVLNTIVKGHDAGVEEIKGVLDFNSAFSGTFWMTFGLRIFSPTFIPPYFEMSLQTAASSSQASVLVPGSPQGSL